jgi:hypothetical protein
MGSEAHCLACVPLCGGSGLQMACAPLCMGSGIQVLKSLPLFLCAAAGPPPTLNDALICRGSGLFRLLPAPGEPEVGLLRLPRGNLDKAVQAAPGEPEVFVLFQPPCIEDKAAGRGPPLVWSTLIHRKWPLFILSCRPKWPLMHWNMATLDKENPAWTLHDVSAVRVEELHTRMRPLVRVEGLSYTSGRGPPTCQS